MLRVSEFCRGALSPVSDKHLSTTCPDDRSILDGREGVGDEEQELGCSVRLRVWNGSDSDSSSPISSSSAKVPLDVLKGLSLQDGDYAFLEKHILVDGNEPTVCTVDTVLQAIVIRLELMAEEEDEGVNATNYFNNLCLVPPIVLANLGVSPLTIWQQNAMNPSFVAEQEVVFRLRPIHEDTDDCSSEDGESNVTASPWQIYKHKTIVPTTRQRKKIAGFVLLRPLGRAPLWPWFSLATPSATTRIKPTENQSHPWHESSNKQEGPDTGNLPPLEEPEINQTKAAVVNHKKVEDEAEENAWVYPSRSGIILQESTLCEVRYNSETCKGKSRKQSICYYEVLRIEEAKDSTGISFEDEMEQEIFYVTGPSTQFELDSRPLSAQSHVRRLPLPPPLSCQSNPEARTRDDHGHDGYMNTKETSEDKRNDQLVKPRKLFPSPESTPDSNSREGGRISDKVSFSCHPDWKEVANALLDAPLFDIDHHDGDQQTTSIRYGANSLANSRILHLIGTEIDHDLQTCVATAASMVGMQCLSIKGLAAFGYEHRRSNKNRNGAASSGVTVGSSMVEQKLAGIDAALEYVKMRRMEPCVLHFSAVDEELASISSDDQLRYQVEDRFWSKWTEGLMAVSERITNEKERSEQRGHFGRRSCRSDDDYYLDRLDYRYTPRIFIVISTKAPLEKGPWLERLVFPSITLSLPDDPYIHYLWNSSGVTSNHYDDDGEEDWKETVVANSVELTTEMITLLRGRPAQEIVQLKQQISSEIKGGIGEESYGNVKNDSEINIRRNQTFQCLEKICEDFDASRRTASSDVARISKVSWDDVGGLDHIRAEINNAIELPLKHPHLFPPNTGRSGILLFGPPGTGKTLVAKAVATECGLPFVSVKGPELLGSYIGESEANIRKVFSSARLAAENNLPARASILFFDELDSLAPKRGGNSNHGGGVMERVVASLLSELDGGDNHKDNSGRVFFLGATNRPDLLDPSLLRPGRLDRLVYLGIPTSNKERTRVLASQLRKMKLEGDAFEMASAVVEDGLPPRLSGADISKLSSGAMLNAIRRLCRQADRELEEQSLKYQQEGDTRLVTIDEILESWGDERCTPIITLDDLRLASKDVSPSLSEEELLRYERLKAEHETSSNRTI